MPSERECWTRKTPTEPGFYWWRSRLGAECKIVDVTGERLWAHGTTYHELVSRYANGQWYGPLKEPGGDAIENCSEEEAKAVSDGK